MRTWLGTLSKSALVLSARPSVKEFLRALCEALADESSAPAAEREAVLSRLSEEVLRIVNSPEAKAKEKTTAMRAMGQLMRAGVAIGSQAGAYTRPLFGST